MNEQTQNTQQGSRRTKEKTVTTVQLSRREATALRELAARFGLLYTTGPMAGIMGNPRALCELITQAYEACPEETYSLLAKLRCEK